MRGDGPWHNPAVPMKLEFPPHARGWTLVRMVEDALVAVSPACAGMDRLCSRRSERPTCFPRMRGDGPYRAVDGHQRVRFPPHARGWTVQGRRPGRVHAVSPACAGMDPLCYVRCDIAVGFPRMRGDGPVEDSFTVTITEFPPHARGWTSVTRRLATRQQVSPACAGMDHCCQWRRDFNRCFPRMRGDGPVIRVPVLPARRFPPHARGWTLLNQLRVLGSVVSPACAGMDPVRARRPEDDPGFPRMRGDGPDVTAASHHRPTFPPHARGWTVSKRTSLTWKQVSPACAGMDPLRSARTRRPSRFPRMRGDGPATAEERAAAARFPPHARGWTGIADRLNIDLSVSPACAGMDRGLKSPRGASKCFPRMRGDGPVGPERTSRHRQFPPHARGWTRWPGAHIPSPSVSPACAGMDRTGTSPLLA